MNKTELNVLQGQHIYTLLHPYSALSLIDNLPVLSEGCIFSTGTGCTRLYQYSIRTSRLMRIIYAVLKGSRERDIVRDIVQITPELPTATTFYLEM